MVLAIDNHSKFKSIFQGKTSITKKDITSCEWKYAPLNLFVPKFRYEYQMNLNDVLQKMGIKAAFDGPDGNADFSGINGERNLFIGDVIHKARIEVDESGTKAAAATVIRMKAKKSARRQKPVIPTIRFDHPFDFFIIDEEKKFILFSGRYTGNDIGSNSQQTLIWSVLIAVLLAIVCVVFR